MSKEKFANNLFKWSVMAAVVVVALPDAAFGQAFNAVANKFTTNQIGTIPNVLRAVAWTGGAVLAISGALKLKAHAENPAQEKMAPGIARLLTGGALAILPYLLGTMQQTATMSSSAAYSKWTTSF